jgi:hypothetical protein
MKMNLTLRRYGIPSQVTKFLLQARLCNTAELIKLYSLTKKLAS